MKITATVADSWLIARLEKAPMAHLAAVSMQMEQVASYMYDRVYKKLSGDRLNVVSGRLRRNLQKDVVVVGDKVTARVFIVGVPYARIQERGGKTRPHLIVPRMARALRFEVGGGVIYAMRVRHPGSRIPASLYMRSVLIEERTRLNRMIKDAEKRASKS